MFDVHAVRAAIPVTLRHSYLNCGTYGPLPAATADEMCRLVRLVAEEGTFNRDVFEGLRLSYEAARERLARFLGAEPDEIALTGNVSTGVNIVANGLDLQPGDEVILTDEEHPSGAMPWINLAHQRGVVLRVLKVDPDPALMLEHLEELVTPRTRMVFVSHVSCISGIRLPVAEVCAVARRHGALSMLDGAHAVGAVPVDVRQLGCDFYAANCHKWLLGPQGTAFAWIPRERLAGLRQVWVGGGSSKVWSVPDLPFEPADGAQRFEFGTRPFVLYAALLKSLDLIEGLGVEAIQAHSLALTAPLKAVLRGMRGVEVLTPDDPERCAGLVAFYARGLTEPDAAGRMWRDHNIIIHYSNDTGWLRLSAACFTLPEEVERVVDLLRGWEPS